VTSRNEGLRARKKRLMRQLLSDTATEMFLERGFDNVRVVEIAEACGVSEKTVFNYFPTKESLLLDRFAATMAALRTGLADPDVSPIDAVLRILAKELAGMTYWLNTQEDATAAALRIARFRDLIQSTASLRAHQRDGLDKLVTAVAELLAERAGLAIDDPEPQIAATALLGLWQVHFRGLRTYLDGTRTPAAAREAVTADVRRAAELLTTGFARFAVGTSGTTKGNRGTDRRARDGQQLPD
jgi:AcrR family transcriptional regulator